MGGGALGGNVNPASALVITTVALPFTVTVVLLPWLATTTPTTIPTTDSTRPIKPRAMLTYFRLFDSRSAPRRRAPPASSSSLPLGTRSVSSVFRKFWKDHLLLMMLY